jgi:hypothetical protein
MFQTTAYFAVNISRTAVDGAQIYEKEKERLNVAVREFDQSIMHFTARVVASTCVKQ